MTAAVQIIPVLVVVAVVDSLDRRDASHPVHRIYASTALAVGLLFGVVGEIAGLQALLTGPGSQTISMVSGGMAALAATVILPRFAEFHFTRHPDVARRFTQRMLPPTIGRVGIVMSTLSASWPVRGYTYVVVFLTMVGNLLFAMRDIAVASRRAGHEAHQRAEETTRDAVVPARAATSVPATHPRRSSRSNNANLAGLLLVASAISLGVAVRKKR